jgi:hypothetical protein
MADVYEHTDEILGFNSRGEFHDWLSNYHLLKKKLKRSSVDLQHHRLAERF